MEADAAKLIGAGLASIALVGAGVGIGTIFGNYLQGALRNPSAAPSQFANLLLGAKGQEKTRSSFDVSGPLTQVFLLGVIAQRLGGVLEFDRKTKQITNNKLANQLLAGPPPRKGWEQFYKM